SSDRTVAWTTHYLGESLIGWRDAVRCRSAARGQGTAAQRRPAPPRLAARGAAPGRRRGPVRTGRPGAAGPRPAGPAGLLPLRRFRTRHLAADRLAGRPGRRGAAAGADRRSEAAAAGAGLGLVHRTGRPAYRPQGHP